MDHNQPTQDTDQMGNFAGLVLVFTFIIILLIVNSGTQVFSAPAADEGQAVAEVIPTEIPLPTSTPLPPTTTPTPVPTSTPLPTSTPVPTSPPEPTAAEASGDGGTTSQNSASVDYDPDLVNLGKGQFLLCSACHGPDGRGIPNLGKDLIDSEFVQTQTDEQLLDFIKVGRPIWDAENTTGVDMPAKGGNPAMMDSDILAVIAYIRTLAAESGVASQPTTEQADTDSSSTNNSTSFDPDLAAQGAGLFIICGACHGPDGRGIPSLGKDLVASEFVLAQTDEQLLDFIKVGRPIWDPENTTGVDMPPKGGSPAFSDEDMLAIIAYIRSLAADSG